MSRYIDKDKLLDDLKRFAPEPYKDSISDFIEEQPEADVVEVIRCKDCEWWEKQGDRFQGKCTLFGDYPFYPTESKCTLFGDYPFYPTGIWYCASSERKENE